MLKFPALLCGILPLVTGALVIKYIYFDVCTVSCAWDMMGLLYIAIALGSWIVLSGTMAVLYLFRRKAGKPTPYSWLVYLSALLILLGIAAAPFT